jgi:serine/threonine protein phosphatase PrpC
VEAIKLNLAPLRRVACDVVLTAEDVKAVHEGTYQAPQPKEVDLEVLTLDAIQKANRVVYEYTRHKPKTAANAGTTITMLAARGSHAVIANVGDSRTYLLRKVSYLFPGSLAGCHSGGERVNHKG